MPSLPAHLVDRRARRLNLSRAAAPLAQARGAFSQVARRGGWKNNRMWYRIAHRIKKANAYDVLKSETIEWMGNFKATFSQFNPWGKMPDLDHLINWLEMQGIRYMNQMATRATTEEERKAAAEDLTALFNFLQQTAEYYLYRDSVPDQVSEVLYFMAATSRAIESLGQPVPKLTGQSYRQGDVSFASKYLKLDYGLLQALDQSGIQFSPEFLAVILSGRDISMADKDDTEARQEFVRHIVQKYPLYALWLPENRARALQVLSDPKAAENPEILQMLRQSVPAHEKGTIEERWNAKSKIKDLLVSVPSQSGSSAEEQTENTLAMAQNPELEYFSLPWYTPKETLKEVLRRIDQGEITPAKSFVKNLASSLISKGGELDASEVQELRGSPAFMGVLQDGNIGNYYKDQAIELGLGTQEETESLLQRKPEAIKNMRFTGHIDKSKLQQAAMQHAANVQRMQSDGLAMLEEAVKTGVVQMTRAADDPDALSFLMEEGTKRMGLEPEEISAYAPYVVVFKFNSYNLQKMAADVGTNMIGNVPINESWGGLFTPRFKSFDGSVYPAIFIKTDSYSRLEAAEGLAKNLKMPLSEFPKATERHEMGHALHYLGMGDVMMQNEFADPYETDAMNYLNDPAEIFARVHGDIPYLKGRFQSYLEQLKDDPLAARAIKAQWLEDVQNSMAGIGSGGTNLTRLKDDIGKKRGYLGWIPDPLGAINKTLKRQRQRLERGYDEDIERDRRDATLELLRDVTSVRQALEADPENPTLQEQYRSLKDRLDFIRKKQLVFDMQGVGDTITKGYYQDYLTRLTDAVASGKVQSDIVRPDTQDELVEQQQVKRPEQAEPPTYTDIEAINESMIGKLSEEIPAGRRFTQMIGFPLPIDQRKGYYPHKNPAQTGPTSTMTIKPKDPNDPNGANRQARSLRWYRR